VGFIEKKIEQEKHDWDGTTLYNETKYNPNGLQFAGSQNC
jgi:hypothetical protein